MKIAVLFFGQPRFFDITKEYIKKEFTFEGHTTDYFAHLWDNVGYTPTGPETSTPTNVRSILKDYFNAKSFKIDNNDKLDELVSSFANLFKVLKYETNQNIPLSEELTSLKYKFSQHYSLERVFEHLTNYETMNNIKYDVIIKARTDIIYSVPELYKDINQYTEFKNKVYLDIPTDEKPFMKCNGLRIIKYPSFEEQFLNSIYNKKISIFLSQSVPLDFNYTWSSRIALNDWCLICNRAAADIMFRGWFLSYVHALGFDIDNYNMLIDKSVRKKPKFVCNSEHAMQGFISFKNNINTIRIHPHRRDYRVLKKDNVKSRVDIKDKIFIDSQEAILPMMRKIFKNRYPEFYVD
tara:strand:+ start:2469 stop:3521 length:1053 start_codon:yes stop_codon:yes gene_type:complete